jgi:hypothetical protein
MTGLKIIAQAPLTFVGATSRGAVFFGYTGSGAGNNRIDVVFKATSYLLFLPMRGGKMVLNGVILRPISSYLWF